MTEQNIFDNKHITSNSEQISVLKKYFPNCFDKDGRFLINNLKDIVTKEGVDTSHEGYKLDWLGKSYARLLVNEKPRTLITPNKEHNTKDQNKNSNNLLIKGDNLEVLKHLKNVYSESVKVIYIDPPYNTGSDGFIYKDDRKFTKEELANLANVSEEDAKRILDFTDKGSNSHSAWLTFIYPRLYVARELLREDGVIFISIDDNEQAQLKLLCDEVFGEENFVAELPTIMNLKGNNSEFGFAGTHEYTFVYTKNKDRSLIGEFKIDEEEFDNWLEDDIGLYKRGAGLRATGQEDKREDRPEMFYPVLVKEDKVSLITNDDFSNLYDKKTKTFDDQYLLSIKNKYELEGYEVILPYSGTEYGRWRWGFNNQNRLLYKTDSIVVRNNEKISIYKKQRPNLGDLPSKKPKSLFYKAEYSSGNGTSQIQNIFEGLKIFSNPKPVSLIYDFLQIGSSKSSLILDFFAGSGTTAHAVMDLNADDGGNRQYIMVQLPEETDKKSEAYKAGYNTIFDITKARIEKAAEKIRTEKPDYEGDLGFKIFETRPLPEYYDEQIDKLTPDAQGKIWDGSSADDALLQAILTSCTLYDRILLTTDLQTINLSNDYIAYYGIGKGSNTLYLMNKGFTIDNIKDIIDKLEKEKTFTPDKIVVYGHNFDSKSQRELSEAMLNFKNKKQLDIDVIIRY